VSVGIEPVIPDHDLAFIGDVGRDPGDELQIIHRLQFRAVLTMTVANFALMFQKQEAAQRQDGPDHVFPDPLGLKLGPDTDLAVRARLEGLEPPTRCLEGSWAAFITEGR
jgi:hypothetical protein